jgi:hypothetical protein
MTLKVKTTEQIPGVAATDLGKAEDAAHTSGDTGVMMLGVRQDTATPLAGTAGDYIPFIVDANGAMWVSLATGLSAASDSIDEAKRSKGSVTTAHSAITATTTSTEIDCRGFNAVLVEVAISVQVKLWTTKIQGCLSSGGTFIDWYEMANTGTMTLMSYQTNASKGFVFKGIPDYIKIVATEDEDTATYTCRVQPLNL